MIIKPDTNLSFFIPKKTTKNVWIADPASFFMIGIDSSTEDYCFLHKDVCCDVINLY